MLKNISDVKYRVPVLIALLFLILAAYALFSGVWVVACIAGGIALYHAHKSKDHWLDY